jgi:hypothetical protein
MLSVARFRGIRELNWNLDSSFVCLVGPGDSTKTTILDAVGAVLSPRYNLVFTDADFYRCDTSEPIVLTAVVTDLPDNLIEERAHGKNRSGIRPDGSLEHDPLEEDDVEECLIVRLTVDQTLEPVWEVIRPDEETGDRITARERAQLGFFRIGESADVHLRWGRTSALAGMTSSRTGATHAVVEAQRHARIAVAELSDTPLHDAAAIARDSAVKLGSAPYEDLRPGLDPRSGSGASSLVLHEGAVPLTSFGLGSRRLTSLAIQDQAIEGRSILAIDEIESGLDPHRLQYLVRHLRERADNGELQTILTTHSPVAVEALGTTEIFVVRSADGRTEVQHVPTGFDAGDDVVQGVIRERPSALLARRVIVGEGATETGFVRQLLWHWDSDRQNAADLTAISMGVTVTNGAGDIHAPHRAAALATLGYPTLLVADNDTDNDEAVEVATAAGANVALWPEGMALEDVVCHDLPLPALQQLVDLAADESSQEGVIAAVGHRLEDQLDSLDVGAWIEAHGEDRVREAMASAAKGRKTDGSKVESKAWFKREDRGERLAALVLLYSLVIADTDLGRGLQAIHEFAYGAPADSGPVSEAPAA